MGCGRPKPDKRRPKTAVSGFRQLPVTSQAFPVVVVVESPGGGVLVLPEEVPPHVLGSASCFHELPEVQPLAGRAEGTVASEVVSW